MAAIITTGVCVLLLIFWRKVQVFFESVWQLILMAIGIAFLVLLFWGAVELILWVPAIMRPLVIIAIFGVIIYNYPR